MLILGIETSCDETSAAIIDDNKTILSNIIASQIDVHNKYGGVVPELACRKHIENIYPVIKESLNKAKVSLKDIDLIAVTRGPGLVGALLTGLTTAKGLAYILNKPLVGINHIEGHILSTSLENDNITFPFVALIVSGGHTDLYLAKDYCSYNLLGSTRDDAVGEAFDKVSKMLGLGYPGGPLIEKTADNGDPSAIPFPRSFLSKGSLDFSFSGVKTAVKNYIFNNSIINKNDIAASFQEAVIEVLVKKLLIAVDKNNVGTIVIGGGVASNKTLRKEIEKAMKKKGVKFYFPSPLLCTDNAAMVAYAGYHRYKKSEKKDKDFFNMDANPMLHL